MLSSFEVAIYAFSLVLLPLALYSLATGSKAPKNTWLTKYYAAERYLGPTGNIMLIALSASSLAKLATHFGWMTSVGTNDLAGFIAAPFMILVVAYWVLWIRALRKVRRMDGGETQA